MSNRPRMTETEAVAYLAQFSDSDFEAMSVPIDEEIDDERYNRFVAAAHSKTPGRPSLTEPGTESPQITFRLSAATNEKLRQRAAAENVSVSSWARRLIERELADA